MGADFLSDEALVVLTTCDDVAQAEGLAEALVGERLAACVNIVPEIRSVYRWDGAVERGREVLLVIKTTDACLEPVEAAIRSRSGYELPEVLAVPVASGSADYLGWIAESVRS